MTISPVAAQEKPDSTPSPADAARAGNADLDSAATLFSNAGKAMAAAASRDTAALGQDVPANKRKEQEKETVRRARARTDPTALASAELASHGAPKATTRAAEAAQITPT